MKLYCRGEYNIENKSNELNYTTENHHHTVWNPLSFAPRQHFKVSILLKVYFSKTVQKIGDKNVSFSETLCMFKRVIPTNTHLLEQNVDRIETVTVQYWLVIARSRVQYIVTQHAFTGNFKINKAWNVIIYLVSEKISKIPSCFDY